MLLGDALLVGNLVLLGCNDSFSDGVMLVLGRMLGCELAEGLQVLNKP